MKRNIVLFLILLLSFFLRFYRLNSYPALNADEAAIGYNAYSLIRTGKDEHGNPWPLHFQSFNDYKPGLYFYLVLPFVKYFGLNEWSVRIPNAFLGTASVFVIYFLVEEIGRRMNSGKYGMKTWPLVSSFFLAISPWHIHFSRGGWEVNTATFFIVLGVLLFLKGLRNSLFLFLSSLVFSLSLYTYHAARVISPLLVLALLIIYYNEVKRNVVNVMLAGLIALVALTPLVMDFTKSEVVSRAYGVGLFADSGPLARINEQRGEHSDFTAVFPKLIHNKAINYGLAFLLNLSKHYHGEFLFLSGDIIQRNRVPETGQMYLYDLLFITTGLVGIIKMIKSRDQEKRKAGILILLWLIIAPVASALTFQSPHALRAQNMIIPLTIISAYGFVLVFSWLNKNISAKIFLFSIYGSLFALMVWQFARYQHMYWVHMAKEYPYSSQYGVKELVYYLSGKRNDYEKIIITDRYDQPYILFLFYQKYSPANFQNNHELSARDNFGFSTVRNFSNFEFRSINYNLDQPNNPNSLIIGTDEEIPDEANIIKEIYGSNGYKYFQVVEN